MNIFLHKAVKKIHNHEGVLCITEFSDLPFIPKRFFFVKNVPRNTERGNHAHYKTRQVLICIAGKIKTITHDGHTRYENIMEANDAVFIDRMIWDSQIFLTDDAILGVFTDTRYNKKDYITSFTDFKEIVRTAIPLSHGRGVRGEGKTRKRKS